MIFKRGKIYRHSCAKDLDIRVLWVVLSDEVSTLCKIQWIQKTSGISVDKDYIVIKKKEYEHWKEIEPVI